MSFLNILLRAELIFFKENSTGRAAGLIFGGVCCHCFALNVCMVA